MRGNGKKRAFAASTALALALTISACDTTDPDNGDTGDTDDGVVTTTIDEMTTTTGGLTTTTAP
jgi:hypothetical protein